MADANPGKSIPKCEQETTIVRVESDGFYRVYTCVFREKKRIQEMAHRYPEQYRIIGEDGYGGIRCEIDKSCLTVSLRKPMTDEERQMRSDKGKKTGFRRKNEQASVLQ